MATDGASASPLEQFAKANGLQYAQTVELPSEGAMLTHSSGKVEGVASGALPGGGNGSIAHYVYTTTDSDNNTEHHHRTIAWTRVPESIGFVPYLSLPASFAGGVKMKKVELDQKLPQGDVCAFEGTSDSWLRQLFSPSLLDYISRSPADESFELTNGLFCVQRGSYLADQGELRGLCADLAKLAGAVREESREEAESGDTSEAAKDTTTDDPAMERALAAVKLDGSPAAVSTAVPAYRRHLMRRPIEWIKAIGAAILITLVINIPAAAIPILLAVNGALVWLVAFEALIFFVVAYFAIRGRFRDLSKQYAQEAFYRAYAADRHLQLTPPLSFSAAHAEAGVGFKPDRVFQGRLPGGADGALAFRGDGTTRESQIAIVTGPKGPVASAELRSSPGGLSAKDLDDFSARLGQQLAASPAAAPH